MTQEKYTPTKEEIKKGEEMMTQTENQMSAMRNEALRIIKEKTGFDTIPSDFKYFDKKGHLNVSGTFRGHLIEASINHTDDDAVEEYVFVDGIEVMDREKASKIATKMRAVEGVAKSLDALTRDPLLKAYHDLGV